MKSKFMAGASAEGPGAGAAGRPSGQLPLQSWYDVGTTRTVGVLLTNVRLPLRTNAKQTWS